MAISFLQPTKDAIGTDAKGCESRALFAARFADPQATDKTTPTRKKWFNDLIGKKAAPLHPSHAWLPENAEILHARLMSRLMVNLAGGVMENANLLFDRYGYPLIPGSAVKGCARRMALQTLHDWNGALASAGESSNDDITLPCRAEFTDPAHMLAAIALIFGWVPEDWTSGGNSDFAWACGGGFQPPCPESITSLLAVARDLLPPHPTFAGTIAFLPATTNRDPGLELDVVTPHHTAYYEGKGGFEDAPDTEDPVPVFFPTIAPQKDGDYFTFPLIPLRQGAWASCPRVFPNTTPLTLAKLWLTHGLELFGLGAKTNAGYGWFDASAELNREIAKREQGALARENLAKQRLEQETIARAVDEERLRKKRELENALAGLTPDQQEDMKIELLSEAQFDGKVRSFSKPKGGPTAIEKAAIIRALKAPRLGYWQDFKPKAVKGDLAKVDQAIRTLNKQLYADKMP